MKHDYEGQGEIVGIVILMIYVWGWIGEGGHWLLLQSMK